HDGTQMQLLGGDQRKTVSQVETHLVAEHAQGTGPGAVGFVRAVLQDMPDQVEIRAHGESITVPAGHRDNRDSGLGVMVTVLERVPREELQPPRIHRALTPATSRRRPGPGSRKTARLTTPCRPPAPCGPPLPGSGPGATATAATGRPGSAATTAPAPWSASPRPGSRSARPAAARTPPRSGSSHTAAQTGPTPRSAAAVCARTGTAP